MKICPEFHFKTVFAMTYEAAKMRKNAASRICTQLKCFHYQTSWKGQLGIFAMATLKLYVFVTVTNVFFFFFTPVPINQPAGKQYCTGHLGNLHWYGLKTPAFYTN